MSFVDALKGHADGGAVFMPGFADVHPAVKVGGVAQPAVWLCEYAAQGDPVIVAKIPRGDAPGQLVVVGRVGSPGPATADVTAAPAGSETITVTADGTDYQARFLASYSPTVGDRVGLLWQWPLVTALGKVGVLPAPDASQQGTTPQPPPPSSSGVLTVPASDSGTYSVGYGWNSRYGQNLYQGNGSTWGAPADNRGSWFYGNGAGQLAGATIPRVEFRVPARNSAGATSSSVTAHLYLHDSPNRPGGDVNRIAGPVAVILPPGWAGGWVDLPAAWGDDLAAGCGVGITGDPYLGLVGKSLDPESGQAKLHWTR